MPNANGKRTVVVFCGSSSDFTQILSGLGLLRVAEVREEVEVLSIEVCSAHRNPDELREKLLEYTKKMSMLSSLVLENWQLYLAMRMHFCVIRKACIIAIRALLLFRSKIKVSSQVRQLI